MSRTFRHCIALLLLLVFALCNMPASYAEGEKTDELPKDWYGWWKMDRCSGDWAKMYGYYWDCCGELEREDVDLLHLRLWDEDLPKETLLAEALLTEGEGALACRSGSFLDRELGTSDWTITKRDDVCRTLLTFEGQYQAVGKGGFHYVIYLRPWGDLWPGSEEEKPYYYEDWYLPLVKAGLPMPERIGETEEEA